MTFACELFLFFFSFADSDNNGNSYEFPRPGRKRYSLATAYNSLQKRFFLGFHVNFNKLNEKLTSVGDTFYSLPSIDSCTESFS